MNDGLRNPGAAFSTLSSAVNLTIFDASADEIPLVRRDMCAAAARDKVAAVIFSDCDDLVLPDAIDLHLEALSKADISFGNLYMLAPQLGTGSEELYFSPEHLPVSVSVGGLDRGNVIGFGNSAVRHEVLTKGPHSFHKNVALADWFYFRQLLQSGYAACQTTAPVAQYRLMDAGLASIRPRICDEVFNRQANLLRTFLEHQPDRESFSVMIDFLTNLHSVSSAESVLASLPETRGPWFSYFFELCDELT
ncbi:MAG: hypothetical protein AAGD43_01230 [Pseudomonadota bacterium]